MEQGIQEYLLTHLQNRVSDKSSIEDIVRVFEEMCKTPIEEDAILFETGTYDFVGVSMFYFSLVRQFPDCEEEYYQIHVDVLYTPDDGNKDFEQIMWNEDIEGNLFDYIRNTSEYEYCRCKKISKVDIYLDET